MDLSLRNLEQAVSIRRNIDRLQRQLTSLLGGASSLIGGDAGRRRMSAKTRAKLAAAARARWARTKAGTRSNATKTRRRGITPSGRRKLSQMMKARWAAKRKAAGKR